MIKISLSHHTEPIVKIFMMLTYIENMKSRIPAFNKIMHNGLYVCYVGFACNSKDEYLFLGYSKSSKKIRTK